MPKGSLSPKTVMADLIRYLPPAQAGSHDRRSRVKRGMTGIDEWAPLKWTNRLRRKDSSLPMGLPFQRNGYYP